MPPRPARDDAATNRAQTQALTGPAALLFLVPPATVAGGDDFLKEGLVKWSAHGNADADHGDGDLGRGPDNQADRVVRVVVCGEVRNLEGAFDTAGSGAVEQYVSC